MPNALDFASSGVLRRWPENTWHPFITCGNPVALWCTPGATPVARCAPRETGCVPLKSQVKERLGTGVRFWLCAVTYAALALVQMFGWNLACQWTRR